MLIGIFNPENRVQELSSIASANVLITNSKNSLTINRNNIANMISRSLLYLLYTLALLILVSSSESCKFDSKLFLSESNINLSPSSQ